MSMSSLAVALIAQSDMHPEHCALAVSRREKKWRSNATEGAMLTKASHKNAKVERRRMDFGSKCNA